MVNCAVLGCNNESRRKADCGENTTKVSFFSVPTVVRRQCNQTLEVSTKRRAEWFRRLNRGYINTNATHYKVCSEHFVSGRPSYLMDVTNPDWAPSLRLGYDRNSAAKSEARHQRRCKRAATSKEIQEGNSRVLQPSNVLNVQHSAVCRTVTGTPLARPVTAHNKEADEPHASRCALNSGSDPPSVQSHEEGRASAEMGSPVGVVVDASYYVKFSEAGVQATTSTAEASVNTTSLLKDAETQTDITGSVLKSFEADNQVLRTELQEVKGSLDTLRLSKASLEHDNTRVQIYTGLPSFTVLISLFTLVESSVPHSPNNALAKFQEFVLTLMRLRLGVALQDLASIEEALTGVFNDRNFCL
ncbi:uncharacterized protein LOC119384115 isoform X2 [Rhipicephalus sanguineus]|uniref:uncharacterized protein LOC119384115 isoform X2 n=1 Tax=Rhipicephalus sanguineus TaxID=34632 RepID=UPI00189514FF|nr:uncharacterized protein LOC119384115 isoform X2 [Rhipicephalus sanguineus]